jgi:type III pantothenate kinase
MAAHPLYLSHGAVAEVRRSQEHRAPFMLVTIDVGNTHTVIGIYEGERLTHHWRISTDAERTTDEHGVMLQVLLQGSGMRAPLDPEGVAVACVVPPLNQTIEHLAERYFHSAPLIVGPGIKTGMPILYENPKEVGADRIVNAVAAYERYGPRRIRWRSDRARTGDFDECPGGACGQALPG